MTCLYCKSKNNSIFWNKSIYKIYKCSDCDFFFTLPEITEKHDKELFSEAYYKGDLDNLGYVDYEADKLFLKKSFDKRLRWLKNILPADGDWLDFGCALGFGLEVIKDYGFNPYGIDRIQFAVDYAKNRLGFKEVYCGNLVSECFKENKFDIISFFDVLALTKYPLKILDDVANYIKDGGYLVIDDWDPYSFTAGITNDKWHAVAPPNRMFYLSEKFLKYFLQERGFSFVAKKKFGKFINFEALFIKLGFNGKMIDKINFFKKLGIYINLMDLNLYVFTSYFPFLK